MDHHLTRRFFLAVGSAGLIALGLLHPNNAWLLPFAGLAGFLALFALVAGGGAYLLSQGMDAFRPLVNFIRTSEALIVFSGIGHLALIGIGSISWPEMTAIQQGLFVTFGVMGIYGGFREYIYGLRPDGRSDDWVPGARAH